MTIRSVVDYVLAQFRKINAPEPSVQEIVQTLSDMMNAEVRAAMRQVNPDSLVVETKIQVNNGVDEIPLYSNEAQKYWIGDINEVTWHDTDDNFIASLLRFDTITTRHGWPNQTGVPKVYSVISNLKMRLHPNPPNGAADSFKGYLHIVHETMFLPIVDKISNTETWGLTLEKTMLGNAANATVAQTLLGELTPYILNLLVFKLSGNQLYLANAESSFRAVLTSHGTRVTSGLGSLNNAGGELK